jgi:hypothetical protein
MRAFLCILFLFAAFVSLQCAPVGNAAAPKLIQEGVYASPSTGWSIRLGYEGDFVFDGRMEQQGGGRIDEYTQDTNSGVLILNFHDRLDFYGILGSSDTAADWRFINPSDQVLRMEVTTNTSFLWALGGHAILYEWGPACLGFGGRYATSHAELKKISQNGVLFPAAGAVAHWSSWQIHLDLSCRIDFFTPYIGVKYSNARMDFDHFPVQIGSNGERNNHLRNKDPIGFYLGCTISSGQWFMLNLEGRLADEEAATVSADLRF